MKNGQPGLGLLVDPDGAAHATIRRRRDGTLSFRTRGGGTHDELMELPPEIRDGLLLTLMARIMKKVGRSQRSRKAILHMAANRGAAGGAGRLRYHVEQAARQIAGNLMRNVVMVTGRKELTSQQNPHRARARIIRSHLADRATLELANSAAGSGMNDRVSLYNLTARNRELFASMAEEEPLALRTYMRGMAGALEQPAGLKQGGVLQAAADALGMELREISRTTQLGPMFRERHIDREPEYIAQTCRMITRTGMPEEKALDFAQNLALAHTLVYRRGEKAMETWEHLLAEYGRRPEKNRESDIKTLREAGNRITHHQDWDRDNPQTMRWENIERWARRKEHE